jgi:hypothetical protein
LVSHGGGALTQGVAIATACHCSSAIVQPKEQHRKNNLAAATVTDDAAQRSNRTRSAARD